MGPRRVTSKYTGKYPSSYRLIGKYVKRQLTAVFFVCDIDILSIIVYNIKDDRGYVNYNIEFSDLMKGFAMFNSIHKKITERIAGLPDGAVFVPTDFSDVAIPSTASKTLLRLNGSGVVRKLMRGVFWKGSLDEPSPHDVARALARANFWQTAPCGDTALHMFGAAQIKPKVWTYITDGTYRRYRYGQTIIEFRHASGKFLTHMSEKTAMLVQVIKALGREAVNDDCLKKLASKFEKEEIASILNECENTTDWIKSAIRRMLRIKEEN